jgi:mannose-6-phosphate isomerase-like protein (cupin superfamily)
VTPELVNREGGNRAALLLDEDYVGLSLHEIGSHLDCDSEGRTRVYVVIEGEGRLWMPNAAESWPMALGDTWVVPASVGAHRIEARGELVKIMAVDTKA